MHVNATVTTLAFTLQALIGLVILWNLSKYSLIELAYWLQRRWQADRSEFSACPEHCEHTKALKLCV